jgi:hypothetical protein
MAELKQYQEIISLGKTIIQDFTTDESRDRTLQWMAHYLAELITKAEQETSKSQKAKLKKECTEMILKIWEKRANFPRQTRPLAGLSEVLPIIKALEKQRSTLAWEDYISERNDKPLVKFIRSVWQSMQELIRVSLVATITSEIIIREKDWLTHLNHLSEEERTLIEYLDHTLLQKNQFTYIIDKVASSGKGNPLKVEDIIPLLEENIASQLESLETLKKSLTSSTNSNVNQDPDEFD